MGSRPKVVRPRVVAAASIVLALTLATGCDPTREPQSKPAASGGPSFHSIHTIRVKESDSLFIAKPAYLALGDSTFWVIDAFASRLVEVERTGSILRTLGSRGGGPEEFRSPGFALVIGDSILLVTDNSRRRLVLFRLSNGEYLGARPTRGIIYHASAVGDLIRFGNLDMEARTGLLTTSCCELASTQRSVPIPVSYVAGGPLAGMFNGVPLSASGGSVAVGFAGSPWTLFVDETGAVTDSVQIPAIHRRGMPEDVASIFADGHFDAADIFSSFSEQYWLHYLPDGTLVVGHRDADLKESVLSQTLYLSLLSPDRDSACVDGRVPDTGDEMVVANFRGDTLFLVEQRFDSAGRVATDIALFKIDASSCHWRKVR